MGDREALAYLIVICVSAGAVAGEWTTGRPNLSVFIWLAVITVVTIVVIVRTKLMPLLRRDDRA